MMRPQITVTNSESNETITREMNDTEFAQFEADLLESQNRKIQLEEINLKKISLLNRLGLTADEAKILLG